MTLQAPQSIVRSAIAIWACVLVVISASLMVDHWVELPGADLKAGVSARDSTNKHTAPNTPTWRAYHILYADCRCSRRVLSRILEDNPSVGVAETIVLIGNASDIKAEEALNRGYQVELISPEQLKSKYGVESAPMLMVFDPQGEFRYSGGYTWRKQGFEVQHRRILQQLMAGKSVESLPIYGCAVSDSLKQIVDPLGIKYTTSSPKSQSSRSEIQP